MTKSDQRGADPVSDDQDVPEGWAVRRLPEVLDLNPPKPKRTFLSQSESVTFLPMAAVSEEGNVVRPEIRTFGEVRGGYTAFAENDVILAKITPCFENGKSALVRGLLNGIGFGSSEFHVLRTQGALLPEFVFHFVHQPLFRQTASDHMSGTAGQERVTADYMRNVEIPIPPIAEQHRIVEKVEALLTEVNAARDHLARVPAILKRFRQSVLAAACSGRLTEDWRNSFVDIESAHDLLQRVLTTRLTTKADHLRNRQPRMPDDVELDVPSTWCLASCDQLTCLVTSGSRGWAEYYSKDGPIFIRAQDINSDKLVLNSVAHVIPPKGAEGLRTLVQKWDVLITITGANVTKSALIHDRIGEGYISQHVALTRPVMAEIAPWLHLWTISPTHGRAQLLDAAYGAGKPGLSLDKVRKLVVALPPLLEQQEILKRIESLFSLANDIESRVATATARAESITQSVLAKAFRGELVPSEAELARREGRDYETASKLIERIRGTRVDGSPEQVESVSESSNESSVRGSRNIRKRRLMAAGRT